MELGAEGEREREEKERVMSRKVLSTESEKCLQGPPDKVVMEEVAEEGLS